MAGCPIKCVGNVRFPSIFSGWMNNVRWLAGRFQQLFLSLPFMNASIIPDRPTDRPMPSSPFLFSEERRKESEVGINGPTVENVYTHLPLVYSLLRAHAIQKSRNGLSSNAHTEHKRVFFYSEKMKKPRPNPPIFPLLGCFFCFFLAAHLRTKKAPATFSFGTCSDEGRNGGG